MNNELKLKIQFFSLAKRSSIVESSIGQCWTSRWQVCSKAHVKDPLEPSKCLKTEAVRLERDWGLKQQLGIRASETGITLINMTLFHPMWKLGNLSVCTKKAQHIALNLRVLTNIKPVLLKISAWVLLISNTAFILLPERSSYPPYWILSLFKVSKDSSSHKEHGAKS